MLKKIVLLIMLASIFASCASQEKYLTISAGNAVKPALDVLNKRFTEKTGIETKCEYLCMAMLLSSAILTQEADVFFSSSEYYMDKAIEAKVVTKDSVYNAGYLIPVITTPKGNPKKITQLSDFAKPGIALGFCDFENLGTGRLSKQILLAEGLFDKIQDNIKYNSVSPAKLQTVLSLGHLDAAIGALSEVQVFKDTCEIIYLPESQFKYAINSCAITAYSKKRDFARQYIDFLGTPESKKVFDEMGFAIPKNIDIAKVQKVK
jgi:molybdate transport system substrate-binding protein